MNLLHIIGTHALIVSIVGQCFVLYEAIQAKDKNALKQTLALLAALLLATVSLEMRPKSPPHPLADSIGVASGVLFLVPAWQTFRKTRAKRPDKPE